MKNLFKSLDRNVYEASRIPTKEGGFEAFAAAYMTRVVVYVILGGVMLSLGYFLYNHF